MATIDVFNGDADGICALTQLRNATPADSVLVTGVKRDIALLEKVDARAGDQVTVLDVSLDKNREGLRKVLERVPRSSTWTTTSRGRSRRANGSRPSSIRRRTCARASSSTGTSREGSPCGP